MPKPDEDDDCYLPSDEFGLFCQTHGRELNTLNPTYLLPVEDDETTVSRPVASITVNNNTTSGLIYSTASLSSSSAVGFMWAQPKRLWNIAKLGTGERCWAIDMGDLFSWLDLFTATSRRDADSRNVNAYDTQRAQLLEDTGTLEMIEVHEAVQWASIQTVSASWIMFQSPQATAVHI
ncbi:hypothetical protein B0H13DRAFT_1929841 [Mycena leptocephala]|nr:hypothetical protein B0H13DRAFT_1929841 [Mycena leptocephala]